MMCKYTSISNFDCDRRRFAQVQLGGSSAASSPSTPRSGNPKGWFKGKKKISELEQQVVESQKAVISSALVNSQLEGQLNEANQRNAELAGQLASAPATPRSIEGGWFKGKVELEQQMGESQKAVVSMSGRLREAQVKLAASEQASVLAREEFAGLRGKLEVSEQARESLEVELTVARGATALASEQLSGAALETFASAEVLTEQVVASEEAQADMETKWYTAEATISSLKEQLATREQNQADSKRVIELGIEKVAALTEQLKASEKVQQELVQQVNRIPTCLCRSLPLPLPLPLFSGLTLSYDLCSVYKSLPAFWPNPVL